MTTQSHPYVTVEGREYRPSPYWRWLVGRTRWRIKLPNGRTDNLRYERDVFALINTYLSHHPELENAIMFYDLQSLEWQEHGDPVARLAEVVAGFVAHSMAGGLELSCSEKVSAGKCVCGCDRPMFQD